MKSKTAHVYVEHADWSDSNIEAREVIIALGNRKGVSVQFREERDGSLFLFLSTNHEQTSDAILDDLTIRPCGSAAIEVHVKRSPSKTPK